MGLLDRIDSMESSEDISGGQGLERINSVCLLPYIETCYPVVIFASFLPCCPFAVISGSLPVS